MVLRFVALLFLVVVEVSHGAPRSLHLEKGDRHLRRPSLEIVHGKNASIKDFPYMASIWYENDKFLGSAVIINKHWVATVAYNVNHYSIAGISLRVGSAFSKEGGQELKVKKKIIPANYTGSFDWDIAVMKTNKPIVFGKNAKTIKLATENLKTGTKGKLSGWGATNESYVASPTLLKTTLTVADMQTCADAYGKWISDQLFCTSDKKTGPLKEDFGDPLVVKDKVYGLYAGGYEVPVGSKPVLFTSIPKVQKWIKKAIKS